jgi:hypothetical protein
MEYTQLTLDQWVTMKDQLKQDIIDAQTKVIGIKKDFVRIGYKLRKIDELKLYEKDGYKSVAEFAKAECNLSDSDTTRFMQINERYSIGGYSEELREEFLEYGSSKLAEMLSLPDKDMEMFTPEATRESIRELKRFNKSEPETGEADDICALVEKFYEVNPEILNELFKDSQIYGEDTDKLVEIVNPSGNKNFKKGIYFLMMYEENIKIKKFGQSPYTMSWSEFFEITKDIFEEDAAGEDTYKNHFGSSQEEQIPGQMNVQDYPELLPETEDKKQDGKEDFAPAQKSSEALEIPNEQPISEAPKTEKTDEQKYAEEQAKIDGETKKKLEEMEDEQRMSVLPSEMPKTVHSIRRGKTFFEEILKGVKPFTLLKDDKNYKVGDILEKMEFDDGKHTGRSIKQEVIYKLEDCEGLVEGYCILGTKIIERPENESLD